MSVRRVLVLVGVSLAALVTGAGTVLLISRLTEDDATVEIAVATASLTNDMAGLLSDIDATSATGSATLEPRQRARLSQGLREAGSLARRARADLDREDAARGELVAATREVRAVLTETTAAADRGGPALRATARLGRQRLERVNARLQDANNRGQFAAGRLDDVARAQAVAGLGDVDLPYTTAAVNGVEDGQLLGSAVAPAGDVNDDGKADAIVAAPGSGEAFVLLGGATRGQRSLSDLPSSSAIRISGLSKTELYVGDDETEEDVRASAQALGRSHDLAVAGIGDIDGDGKDDVAVGARSTDGPGGDDAGAVFVVYGSDRPEDVDVESLGRRGFRIDGPGPHWNAGMAVAGGHDLNGDGNDDLVVGGREHRGRQPGTFAEGPAVTWMVPGRRRTGSVRLTRRDPPQGGWRLRGIGTHLAVSGDVNGDGLADLVGGDAYNRMDSPGSAAIVYGRRKARLSLSTDSTRGGVVPIAVARGTVLGTGATALGDVNGDGLDDLGLVSRTVGGVGRAHVIFGGRRMSDRYRLDRANGRVADITLGRVKGSRDWAADGLAAAGDLNRDGHADLILSTPPAPWPIPTMKSTGTLIADGRRVAPGTRTTAPTLAGRGAAIEYAGVAQSALDEYSDDRRAVAGVGDADGDGQADLVIGVPRREIRRGDTDFTRFAGAVFVTGRSSASATRGALDGIVSPRGLGIVRVGQSAAPFGRRVGGTATSGAAGDGECGYLSTRDARVSFLTHRGRVSRVEVNGPGYLTETGIQVGDPARAVEQAYPRNLRREQHEYYPGGQYLKVRDRRGGRLNFNIDKGRVTAIWAGTEPDVDFVEGCA